MTRTKAAQSTPAAASQQAGARAPRGFAPSPEADGRRLDDDAGPGPVELAAAYLAQRRAFPVPGGAGWPTGAEPPTDAGPGRRLSSPRRPVRAPGRVDRITAELEAGTVRRVPSDFHDDGELEAMDLGELDQHAHDQADWASSPRLRNPERFRRLLSLARGDEGRILDGCGIFSVGDLLAAGVSTDRGTSSAILWYCRAAATGRDAATVRIEKPATSVAEARTWGEALGKLHGAMPGLLLQKVIPQNETHHALEDLVNAGAVDDFIAYYQSAKPMLQADNGAEIRSYLEFRREGIDHSTYSNQLFIRNYHRFSARQLQAMVDNLNKDKVSKKVCLVVQSAYDHNGAFHREPNLTAVLERKDYITLVVEGEKSLDDIIISMETFTGEFGELDEIMLSGHGESRSMEMAGDMKVGRGDRTGREIYGPDQPEKLSTDSDAFMTALLAKLKNDPGSRVVLNACLTASNSVSGPLSADPDQAATEIQQAIQAKPSLATWVQGLLAASGGQGEVRGANASFDRGVALLDAHERIDIDPGRADPKLTASKLEYTAEGNEPAGVLRAAVESWAKDRGATITALQNRLAARRGNDSWDESVVRALSAIVVNEPDNGELLNQLAGAADVLATLSERESCRVENLRGVVPPAHMGEIFSVLENADVWWQDETRYLQVVVYQVWMEHDSSKKNQLVVSIDEPFFDTQYAKPFLDLDHIEPLLDATLIDPAKPHLGSSLLALLYLIRRGEGAPQVCKDYLVHVARRNTPPSFEPELLSRLKGASPHRIFDNLGLVASPGGAAAAAPPTPNIDPKHAGVNTLHVRSLTTRGKVTKETWSGVGAYDAPGGKELGKVKTGTDLVVIGETETAQGEEYLAVELTLKGYKTVFVKAGNVTRS